MLAGTTNFADRCHPVPGATLTAISARCRFIASVLQVGRIRAAPLPCFGQIVPKM
jgi:hypothetical protein